MPGPVPSTPRAPGFPIVDLVREALHAPADVAGAAEAAGEGPALRSRLEHVAQQVTMLRGSVARWTTPEG
ncbi:MAG: hypothetical protein EPO40_17405 [Myxococcaceae bacterium]|nr:MAG: hypothetical protein EPO40_17405 [Myxococcaceae bacterium]